MMRRIREDISELFEEVQRKSRDYDRYRFALDSINSTKDRPSVVKATRRRKPTIKRWRILPKVADKDVQLREIHAQLCEEFKRIGR